jgi:hypothetical protein
MGDEYQIIKKVAVFIKPHLPPHLFDRSIRGQ